MNWIDWDKPDLRLLYMIGFWLNAIVAGFAAGAESYGFALFNALVAINSAIYAARSEA